MPRVALLLNKVYRIDEIVAHTGRMSLLEELVTYDAEGIVAGLTIRENTEFYVVGVGVPAWVGIEYMAQAIGAYSGIEDVQAGKKPNIGLLLGTRRYTSEVSEFSLGMRLEVTAKIALRDEANLVAFNCAIHHAGKLLARADLKGVRPDDVHALVESQTVESQTEKSRTVKSQS